MQSAAFGWTKSKSCNFIQKKLRDLLQTPHLLDSILFHRWGVFLSQKSCQANDTASEFKKPTIPAMPEETHHRRRISRIKAKFKGLCNIQTISPFGCLNCFAEKYLSIPSGCHSTEIPHFLFIYKHEPFQYDSYPFPQPQSAVHQSRSPRRFSENSLKAEEYTLQWYPLPRFPARYRQFR